MKKQIREIRNKIIGEFKLNGYLNMQLHFMCYSEDMATYELSIDDCVHEITIINNEKEFLREMTIEDLLKDDFLYLCHSLYYNDGDLKVREELIDFSLADYTEFNPDDIKIDITGNKN